VGYFYVVEELKVFHRFATRQIKIKCQD
jgi:hypothetical protein